jgi:hypothetical protein
MRDFRESTKDEHPSMRLVKYMPLIDQWLLEHEELLMHSEETNGVSFLIGMLADVKGFETSNDPPSCPPDVISNGNDWIREHNEMLMVAIGDLPRLREEQREKQKPPPRREIGGIKNLLADQQAMTAICEELAAAWEKFTGNEDDFIRAHKYDIGAVDLGHKAEFDELLEHWKVRLAELNGRQEATPPESISAELIMERNARLVERLEHEYRECPSESTARDEWILKNEELICEAWKIVDTHSDVRHLWERLAKLRKNTADSCITVRRMMYEDPTELNMTRCLDLEEQLRRCPDEDDFIGNNWESICAIELPTKMRALIKGQWVRFDDLVTRWRARMEELNASDKGDQE